MSEDPNEKLLPGRVFGAYEIVRAVGDGSFGCVYEALKLPLRRRVALKVLHATHITDSTIVGRFLREAESAAKLNHPHIVETYDVGVVEGMPFIAMEYLEGETLKARILRERVLPIADCADVVVPVLSAAALMHAQSIVHRDLKPENIFLQQKLGAWHPKVLDFGVAKANDQRNLSAVGTRLGSPLYMAPEQHDGKGADARSDVWALGVIAYQCATGKVPFPAKTLPELYRKVVMEPVPTMRLINPSVPVAFEAAVMRALEKDPARRWQSAREMGAALFSFASPMVQHAMQHEFGMLVTLSSQGGVAPKEDFSDSGVTLLSTAQWTGPQPGLQQPAIAPRPTIPIKAMDPAPFGGAPQFMPPQAPQFMPPQAPQFVNAQGPTSAPPGDSSPLSTPLRSRRGLWIGLSLAALAVIVGAAVAAAVLLDDEAPAPTPAADAAVAPATRHLRVRVTPPTATLQLDQEPAAAGALERELRADTTRHMLRVSAPGYEPQSFTFSADAPPPETIALTPLPPPPTAQPIAPLPQRPSPPPRPVRGGRNRAVGNL
jgi:serine/threonine-protein kinase